MFRSLALVLIAFVVSLQLGCSGGASAGAAGASASGNTGGAGSGGGTGGGSGGTPPPSYQMVPLAWESQVSGSQQWSAYLFNLILTQAPAMMAGSSDVTTFCTQYPNMSNDEKANFWAYLISEVAYYESGFDVTNRYVETGLGTDPVTGQQVVSEGLLQLSYQDQLSYPFCQFNWPADSKLSPTDPNKTIFNPEINLQCGTLIMNELVQKHDLIAISSGAYWSTLEPGSQYNKLSQIRAATQALPFCQNP